MLNLISRTMFVVYTSLLSQYLHRNPDIVNLALGFTTCSSQPYKQTPNVIHFQLKPGSLHVLWKWHVVYSFPGKEAHTCVHHTGLLSVSHLRIRRSLKENELGKKCTEMLICNSKSELIFSTHSITADWDDFSPHTALWTSFQHGPCICGAAKWIFWSFFQYCWTRS